MRRRQPPHGTPLLIGALLLLCAVVRADDAPSQPSPVRIVMADGSIVVADEIVDMHLEVLRLKTPADLSVQWLKIRSIECSQTLRIEVRDGTKLNASLSPALAPGYARAHLASIRRLQQ